MASPTQKFASSQLILHVAIINQNEKRSVIISAPKYFKYALANKLVGADKSIQRITTRRV
jgi:hypothetical protein